ncbi:MAG: FG-GAP-like repeat-containing protein [Bacteroidales bacterium]|nr:FG-GAP-like repeat-containing protein [Bacteroidales bacterium]
MQNNVIRIYNNQGTLLSTFGNGKGYSSLAVADLDGDGDMEIIAGFSDGVHVWHHNGTPFSVNPFFTEPGYLFDATPVVCDLNGDGKKDILISARSGTQRQVFAIDLDRNKLYGWGTNQKVPFANGTAISHELAVGDLDNNGSLEVVALGNNCIKIWNKNGYLVREIALLDVPSPSKINPILADIDGDNKSEILFGHKSMIHAYKYNGTQAEGFPLHVETGVREILSSVCVADVTANGKNNIIARVEDKIYMWETGGNAEVVEWGSERRNSHNRGEYPCMETVVTATALWNGPRNLCGDLRIQAGTLILHTTCVLNMHANSKIWVEPRATLYVNSGKIYNAKICALPGSKLRMSGTSYIQLTKNGSLEIHPGAEVEITSGEITGNSEQ